MTKKIKKEMERDKGNAKITHTLRHEEESNPGGRFPLGAGSICKTQR